MLKDLFLGFIKIHILYHAAQEPICGVEVLQELQRHGYRLSPGTVYPTLHRLARDGYLTQHRKVVDSKVRKYYTITDQGLATLGEARAKKAELVNEVMEEGRDTQ